MNIDSLAFCYIFLPISIILFYATQTKHKASMLACISWAFYLIVSGGFAIYIFANALCDFAILQGAEQRRSDEKIFLAIICFLAIKVLTVFMTGLFVGSNFGYFGLFVYSMTVLKYIRDIYISKAEIEKNFVKYVLFTSFFAKAYIGPIVSYKRFIPQLSDIKPSLSSVSKGLVLFIKGLAKKVILANGLLGLYMEMSTIKLQEFTILSGWIMLLCMAMGIFFTIAAYSDMAMGICAVFSIEISKNTYYPYQAKTFEECLSRINMSFYDFLFEGVYAGKSGNIFGRKANSQEIAALFLSVVGVALWLNFSIAFFAWGVFMFCLILAERYIYRSFARYFPSMVRRIFTFAVVLLSLAPLSIVGSSKFELSKIMLGQGAASTISNQVMYLLTTNYLLIGLCLVLSTSSINSLTGYIQSKFPKTAEVFSVILNCALLMITTALML